MTHTQQRIEEIRENGYQLNFLDVFNHALENYKKTVLYAGPVILVFCLIIRFFGFDFLNYFFSTEDFILRILGPSRSIDLSAKLLLIYMSKEVLIALSVALFTPLFLKMADCKDKKEKINLSTIFCYYRLPCLVKIIGATLFISIVEVSVPIWMKTLGLPLLGAVVSLLISLFTYLTIPLIIFGNLNAVEAIKSSFIVVSKQPLTLIVLLIVTETGAMLGFMLYFFGAVFTIPAIYSMIYAVYSSIIGSEIEEPDSDADTKE